MPQPSHVSKLPVPPVGDLPEDLRGYLKVCEEKLGLVPQVLMAYGLRPEKLRTFIDSYNALMLGPSGLSKLEREMIAVVVSSANRCYYCLVAHGQAVRALSGDPQLGEMMVMNYRVADLEPRQRAMLDFAWDLTLAPHSSDDAARARLHAAGFSNEEIFDIAETAAFFNYTNRMAHALDIMPNADYHAMNR